MIAFRRERRYTIDTNLYIDALRTEEGKAALNAFHASYAPFEHLSAGRRARASRWSPRAGGGEAGASDRRAIRAARTSGDAEL